jgi:hypothetical protein
MWEAIPAQSFDERLFPSACIRVSGTTISDLLNSRESQNSWNCGSPETFWSCGLPTNCGIQKHIGVAAPHGTAQFRGNPLPSKGFGAMRALTVQYSHKVTSQQTKTLE